MPDQRPPAAKRRGAQIEPSNRFEAAHHEPDFEHREFDDELQGDQRVVGTQFIPDQTQSLITENNSPDIPFRFSINPYRGCEHGCAYCYARPTHEYLGMNAGIDFETKIMVKLRAPDLLRDDLNRPSWKPQLLSMSGVTDCYQPGERQFRLTRGCLEVLLEARQPVTIVTKNALVLRDLDLLRPMAVARLVHVAVSITTLDAELARTMEPRTSPPRERLRAVRELSDAGVPVAVMVAPVVPGLTDSEVPAILAAARDAGAGSASYIMLRLPLAVEPVFRDWLERNYPMKKDRVESRVRAMRGGQLNDGQFGSRMRGTGFLADEVEKVFDLFAKKLGLDGDLPPLDCSQFRPPRSANGQLHLF
jgi:DNA repair photolyase